MNGIGLRLLLSATIGLVALLVCPTFFAQNQSPQPDGENAFFKDWLDGKNASQIPWTVVVKSQGLSDYQRIQASVAVYVFLDKKDISDGAGKLLSVVRFTNAQGRSFEANESRDLKVPTVNQSAEIVLNFSAYLLPGDYKVAVVVYSAASQKHSVSHQTLHIAPIANDPLPAAWTDLPAVEFFPTHVPLGLVSDGLQLPLLTKRSVRLDVLANATPSYAFKPDAAIYRRNLEVLFPELDVLSQITLKNGSLNVAALELDNHKITFEQDGLGKLDALALWRALMAHSANVVDAGTLTGQTQNARFFVSQVIERASAPTTAPANSTRVIVVLSNEMAFPKGEDLSPIAPAGDCECQIFYIRTHVLLDPQTMEAMRNLPQVGPTGPDTGLPDTGPSAPARLPRLRDKSTRIPNTDELEKTLAPLHPRVFDVKSPTDFRKAVAEILREIGRL
jgi:hypothetical protein